MKEILSPVKFGLRPNESAAGIGSEQLFGETVAGGWIEPVVRRNRLTLYDRSHAVAPRCQRAG